METLSRQEILKLFNLLNVELQQESIIGELYLAGGAVMCLVFESWAATKDVDAFFKPSDKIRKASARVALKAGLSADWLNDGVKGFLKYTSFLDLSHLKVMVAVPEYMLAMKCMAMRIGEEFHDEADVRYLLRNLDIRTYEKACEVISKYYPLNKLPQKTLYALEEILTDP